MDRGKSLIRRALGFVDFIIPLIVIFSWLTYRYFTVGLTSYVRPFELIIISLTFARMATPRREVGRHIN